MNIYTAGNLLCPKEHQILKERINSLLNIVGDSSGDYKKADEAEQRLIEELRLTGNELMRGWASGKESVRHRRLCGMDCESD